MKKMISLFLTIMLFVSIFSFGEIDALATETNTTIDSPNDSDSNWEIDYFVDDFGDPTDRVFLRSKPISGTFSNTATSNSSLKAILIFEPYFLDPENIVRDSTGKLKSVKGNSTLSFRLLEYDDHIATYTSSDKKVLKMKMWDETYSLDLKGEAPNGDVFLYYSVGSDTDKTMNRWVNALREEKEVKCVIEIGSSKYSFTLDGKGFKDTYTELQRLCGLIG